MTTNGVNNVEEADITECDGEKVVTMMDVLQEQQEFEDDANAVLGASDDKECTYSKGYIKRQAIYACITCCSGAKYDPTQRAGVCLACSLNCHENHELIELYTKRNFRCDCGNPKFNSHPCQFTPNKTELNEDNNYNQNFSGIYCICTRPYPDPEATVEEEMIQCIICEDWLHSNHLEAVVPANDLYAEMICKACMVKNDFLHDYSQLAVNYDVDIDVTSINGVDNSKNGNDTNNTDLVNGKMDTSDITEVNMEEPSTDAELKDNGSTSEDGKTMTEDADADETNSNMKCTSDTSEKLSSVENTATGKENDHAEDTNNSTDPEPNTNLDDLDPHSEDAKENVYSKTKPDSKLSESSSSQNDTEIAEEKDSDSNKELTKPSLEQTDSSTQPTEQDIKSTEKSPRQDNTNSLEEDNISNTHNGVKGVSEAFDEVSKDSNIVERNTMSPATDEEKRSPSEPTDSAVKEVLEKTDTEVCPKQRVDCEADSLEAATKELSELMENEGEVNQSSNNSEPNRPSKVDQTTVNEPTSKENGSEDINNTNKNTLLNDNILNNTENDHKRKLNDITDEVLVKKQKLDQNDNCLRPRGVKRMIKGAAFWPSNFRQKLCTCNDCLSMYKDLSVLFLTDQEDTVTAYETLGKEKIDGGPTTQYEKGLQALSSLDRVQQINALTEYNRMRDKLLDFLKSFKDRKEIVKEEDIKAFFAGMKPRREPDGVYFCR